MQLLEKGWDFPLMTKSQLFFGAPWKAPLIMSDSWFLYFVQPHHIMLFNLLSQLDI